jgi:hypothetical protein
MSNTMPDTWTPQRGSGSLVDDSIPPHKPGVWEEVRHALENFFGPQQKELITLLRAPTPVKVSRMFTVGAGGIIGGGVALPTLDQIIFSCPESSEAWIHRITLSSPENTAANPIQASLQTLNSGQGNPAAGAQFVTSTFQTLYGKAATLVSVQFTLTTSATAGNRLAQLVIAGNTYPASVAQTASLVETYNFYPGATNTTVLPASGGVINASIPSILVPSTSGLSSNITGLLAGDQISAITWVVQVLGSSGTANAPEISLIGSTAGETILSLPETTNTAIVVPSQWVEGRLSAPHLDRGENLCINGDGLTAGNHIRVDLQVLLITGASEFTPKTMSPTNLDRARVTVE